MTAGLETHEVDHNKTFIRGSFWIALNTYLILILENKSSFREVFVKPPLMWLQALKKMRRLLEQS